jgi:hypothetical protein
MLEFVTALLVGHYSKGFVKGRDLVTTTPFCGASPHTAPPANEPYKGQHGATLESLALHPGSTGGAVGPLHGLPCTPIQLEFKDHHRQGMNQIQGCQNQGAQFFRFLDLLKEWSQRRGIFKDLGQIHYRHGTDHFSMKDLDKTLYILLRISDLDRKIDPG